jgi:cell filamentation protein
MAKLFEGLRRDNNLRGLSAQEFTRRAASFLATLNHVHAFRDGNGRSQLAFMSLLAKTAGHPPHLARIIPDDFLAAMIQGFRGDEKLLVEQINRLL